MARLGRTLGRLGIVALFGASALAGCRQIIGLDDLHERTANDASTSDAAADTSPGADANAGDGPQGNDATVDASADAAIDGGTTPPDACGDGGCADVVCTGSTTACGDTCVNLTSSAGNCGRCNHDCGGANAQCMNSECQPETLVSAIDVPTSFAVDSNGIYFAVDDILKACALDGCATGTRQIATLDDMSLIAAVNGSVVFIGYAPGIAPGDNPTSIYACPTSGCPNSALPGPLLAITHGPGSSDSLDGLAVSGSDLYVHHVTQTGAPTHIDHCVGLTSTACSEEFSIPPIGLGGLAGKPSWTGTIDVPIAADSTNAYFVLGSTISSASGADDACDAAPCTTTVVPVTPSQFVAYDGTIYFVGPIEGESANCSIVLGCGPIFSCPTSGCTVPTPVANLGQSATVSGLAVDSSGFYFIEGSAIETCPLSGCGIAGPVTIATGQTAATMIQTSNGFVYWVNAGGTGTTSIVRIAEP